MVCWFVKNEREKLQQKLKTKAGAEPKMAVLVDAEDDPVSIFIVADGCQLCEVEEASVASALLVLLATYFTLNLDLPDQYSQLLGLLQHHCLAVQFPESKRKSGFMYITQLM